MALGGPAAPHRSSHQIRYEGIDVNRNLLTGAAMLTPAFAAGAPKTADAFRGGGFGGGGFHAGGLAGGGAWHAGGVDGGWHAGALGPGGGWHAGGVTPRDGLACRRSCRRGLARREPLVAAPGTPMAGTPADSMARPSSTAIMAAATLAIGAMVATVPAGCPYHYVNGVDYYVCGGTWYQPYYGANGLYYRVVPPL